MEQYLIYSPVGFCLHGSVKSVLFHAKISLASSLKSWQELMSLNSV